MSRAQHQPRVGLGIPRSAGSNTQSGTDWMLISSLSMSFAVLIYVLSSVIMPRAMARAEYARFTAAQHDMRVLASAVRNFRLDCDRYPTTDEGLGALVKAPIENKGWNGPYVSELTLDPWRRPYVDASPGPTGRGFELRSHGPLHPPSGVSLQDLILDDDGR